MIKPKTFTLLILILSTLTFSQEFFLDIPKRTGFVIEYGRIVRQLKIEKRTPIHDYDGTWSVFQRINAPSKLANSPFEVPTLVKLSNDIIISDNKNYGDIYIEMLNDDEEGLSKMLYEAEEITFCTFPWLFENGTLEVQKSEYSKYLPVYITNMGFQKKLDALFEELKADNDTFSLVLDESRQKRETQTYTAPPEIDLNIPENIVSREEKTIVVGLNEEILLYEYDYGYWHTLDHIHNDSSILMKIAVPGEYRILFTSLGHITYYNLQIIE